jgi:DNA primase catalytic core
MIKNYEEVIEKLKEKFVDYLEDRGINTKRNFYCLNPKHEDKNASMGLVPQSNFTKAHCFSCGHIADIFDAAYVLENKPKNGPNHITDTVMYLANKYNVAVEMKELTEEEKYRIEIFNAYKEAAHYVASNPSPRALEEMERRGWKADLCKERLVGGVPSFNEYKTHMKAAGYAVAFLEGVDLLNDKMFNENTLVFTIADQHGRPCGFSVRNLNFSKEDSSLPKYINTSARCPIYEKSNRLYNIHNARVDKGPVVIVEGCSDTEAMSQYGIANAVAPCGTALTDGHISQLAKTGKTNILIAMNGDNAGKKATEKMIEKFSEHRDFTVNVINWPNNQDADEFLRENGTEGFTKLKIWSAFEWKLETYDNSIDTNLIRKEIIPIIANEVSPIEREKMIDVLSEKIDISFDAIKEEVQNLLNASEAKRKKERDAVITAAISDLRTDPTSWKHVFQEAQSSLEALSEKHGEDSFSPTVFLKEVLNFKEKEEQLENATMTCNFYKWREFQEAIDGNHGSTLNVLGGGANCGKTAAMSNMAAMLADIPENYDEDYFVLFHSIDDTLEQFTTRIVTQFAVERYPGVTLNKIKRPAKFNDAKRINDARDYAYKKLERLIREQKILIRGGESGRSAATLNYADEMIKYAINSTKNKRPKAKIIYFGDNFHRYRDFSGEKDERNRFKKLSNACKDMAKKYDIPVWCTMEYNKTVGTGRPTNNSISESIAMEYDANLIMHLYNDLHVKNQLGEEPEVYFTRNDGQGGIVKSPRIEAIIGKNKLNSFKGSLYFDFYADQSRMVPVSSVQVHQDMETSKKRSV